MYNAKISERMAVVGTIDPASLSANTYSTDVIDMQKVRRVLFIVSVGTIGSSGTIDFEVNGDTASNGTFATMVTGKAIAQLTDAGSDDNKQVLVEVTAEEAAGQGFRFIRGDLTTAVAATPCSVVALADFLRYSDASQNDLASVDEII